MKRHFLMTIAGVVLASLGTVAAEAYTPEEKEPKLNQRRENQQARIANGVKTASLTAGESANLERKEARVNREIRGTGRRTAGR